MSIGLEIDNLADKLKKPIAFIALIAGVLLLIYGYNGTQEYQSSIGQITRTLSQSSQAQYDQFVQCEYIGGIIAAVGLETLILYRD